MVKFAWPQRLRDRVAGWAVRGVWVREDWPGERRAFPGHETYIRRDYWAANSEGMTMKDAVCHALSVWDEVAGEPDQLTVVREWHYAVEDWSDADPFEGIEGKPSHDGFSRGKRGRGSDEP